MLWAFIREGEMCCCSSRLLRGCCSFALVPALFHFFRRGPSGRRPVGSCAAGPRSNVRLPISLCLNVRPPISLCLPGVRPGGVGARSYIESTGGGRAVRNCRTPGNTNLGTFLVRVSIGSASSGSSCWADPNGMIPWSEGVGESVRDFFACAARRPACAARLPRGQSVSRWQWRSSLGPLQATCACDARVVQRPKERCQKPLRRERLAGQAMGTEAAAPLPAMSEAPEVVALANTRGSAVAAVAMSDAGQTRGSREE